MGGKVENDWWGVKEQFSKKIVNDFLDNQQYFSRIDRLRIQETEGLFVSNRPICKDVLNAQNEFPELTIGFSRVVYELDKNGKIIFGRIRKDYLHWLCLRLQMQE